MASAVPPNFSWVVPGKLAGLAMPRQPSHYQYMHEHGIRHLVSLTERSPPNHDTSPSLEQIKHFLQIVEDASNKGEAVAVHCIIRPGAIETHDQEKAVIQFHHHIK
uniref:Swiss Army Knife protein DSP-PTPase phosphatase domain-containing protein n=1 Tax=Chelonoidis abingdonii TaxID=106734 RepID=A0A8C0J2C1_CHEAB